MNRFRRQSGLPHSNFTTILNGSSHGLSGRGVGGADLLDTSHPVLRQTRDSGGAEPPRVGPALDVAGLHQRLRGRDDGRRARADVERGRREDPTTKNGGQIQMG